MCEHGCCGLHEDLVLRELHHLGGHMGVPDIALCSLQVLRAECQRFRSFGQP